LSIFICQRSPKQIVYQTGYHNFSGTYSKFTLRLYLATPPILLLLIFCLIVFIVILCLTVYIVMYWYCNIMNMILIKKYFALYLIFLNDIEHYNKLAVFLPTCSTGEHGFVDNRCDVWSSTYLLRLEIYN